MYIYAFWNPLFLNNFSLEYLGVQRKIVNVVVEEFHENMSHLDFSSLASPREKSDGDTFYLSNGLLSWINSPTWDDWMGEIEFLEKSGMQWGRDMAIMSWGQLDSISDKTWYISAKDKFSRNLKVDWLRSRRVAKDGRWVEFEIMAHKLFRGFPIKVLRG